MNILSILLEKVLPIFLLVIVGYFYSKIQKNLDIKSINKFNMTLPFSAYMFYYTYKMNVILNDFYDMVLSVFALLILTYLLVFFILKLLKISNLRGFYFATLFMNVSFLLPILQLQYGDEGLSKGLCFVFISVLLFFSLGLFLVTLDFNKLQQDPSNKLKMISNIFLTPLKNPIFWATILGVGCNILNIRIITAILYPIKLMGEIMIPLAILLIV